jgi:hypothetical protein
LFLVSFAAAIGHDQYVLKAIPRTEAYASAGTSVASLMGECLKAADELISSSIVNDTAIM